jgi:hypothetical protein
VTFTADESNRRRCNDNSDGQYEVWYLTWNDPHSGAGYWLRYTLEFPVKDPRAPLALSTVPYAAIWFARFDPADPAAHIAIHRRFSIPTVTSNEKPFSLRIAMCELTSSSARGLIAGDGHEVSWKLDWEPNHTTHRQLPDVMYAGDGLAQTTVLSPSVRTLMRGELVINGKHTDLAEVVVGQTHLWGQKHAHRWAWGRCALFEDIPDAWLETLSVQLQRGGRTLPQLTMSTLCIEGELYQCNQIRHTIGNRAKWSTGLYEFSASNSRIRLRGTFRAAPGQLITAPYHDPDGAAVFCSNTEVGSIDATLQLRNGIRWGAMRTLRSRNTAHFETGGQQRDASVSKIHQLIG